MYRCICGSNCLYRHTDGEENPSKKSKKESTQGAVAILKKKKRKIQGCVSQNSGPKKSILRKAEKTRLNASAGHTKKYQEELGTKFKSGKEKGHLEALSKKVNLMSEILARPSLRKEQRKKPQDKKSTPAKQHGIK